MMANELLKFVLNNDTFNITNINTLIKESLGIELSQNTKIRPKSPRFTENFSKTDGFCKCLKIRSEEDTFDFQTQTTRNDIKNPYISSSSGFSLKTMRHTTQNSPVNLAAETYSFGLEKVIVFLLDFPNIG